MTKAVQKKYFGGRELPLAEGITQGIAQIMESELVILLASGVQKAEIVFKAITGPVTNELPASILQKHPNCIWLLDQDAAGLLPRELVEMKIRKEYSKQAPVENHRSLFFSLILGACGKQVAFRQRKRMTEGAIVETAVCGEMRRLFCRQKSTTAIFPESI